MTTKMTNSQKSKLNQTTQTRILHSFSAIWDCIKWRRRCGHPNGHQKTRKTSHSKHRKKKKSEQTVCDRAADRLIYSGKGTRWKCRQKGHHGISANILFTVFFTLRNLIKGNRRQQHSKQTTTRQATIGTKAQRWHQTTATALHLGTCFVIN